MTNGCPLVVRGAMKPLPTLTKPLQSVDTETHEPAQALRERTDSCTVPAAGVVGEAMVALVLAGCLSEQVRRRPHRRRARGGPRLPGADRMAFVLIGFMGAGKSTVAAELAEALGVAPLDSDALLEERLGHPVAQEFELHGEASFRAKEEELVCELLAGAAPAGRDRARRRQRPLRTGARGARVPRDGAARRRSGGGVGARAGLAERSRAATCPRPSRPFCFSTTGRRADLTSELADAVLPGLPAGSSPGALGALRALSSAPAGARLLWAPRRRAPTRCSSLAACSTPQTLARHVAA